MRNGILTTLAAIGLCCAAAGAQIQRVDETVRAEVVQELQLRDFTIQRLDLPAEHTAFTTDITLGGTTFDVWVEPASFRAEGAFATIVGDDGVIREIPLPAPVTVRGELDLDPEARAAGSRMGGGLHLAVCLAGAEGDQVWTVQPLTDVLPDADPSLHIVHREEDVQLEKVWRCGVDDPDHDHAMHDHAAPHEPGGPRNFLVCELAFEADWEFYNTYHGQSEQSVINDIDTIMARVSAVYETYCNVTFVIPHYNIWTTSNDPYTSTDPSTRLNQFRTWWNQNKGNVHRDLAHFFTGANINGGVIGVAYLSVVCNLNSGYGLSQSRFTTGQNARGALTAHELGHNFSAGHCDGNGDCHIMCSGLGGCNGLGNPARFGQPSANRITNYAANRPCLEEDGIPFPFLEEFLTTTIDDTTWVDNNGGVINENASNEPSAPYSLNLDGSDSIQSGSIDLGGVVESPFVTFYSQHVGVEDGETLTAEYLDLLGDWNTMAVVTSDGVDESSFSVHTFEVPIFGWHEEFAIRFRAEGSDGTDDWYIDDISVGPFLGVPLPVLEEFPSTSFDSVLWNSINGADIDDNASNEPSEPYAMVLDATDEVTTNQILMAGAPFPTYVSFFTQHKGVESGKTLTVEYFDLNGDWQELVTITSNGNDQSRFEFFQDELSFDAYTDDFALRFTANGANPSDDWYVDDIRIGDEFTPPDDCVADFNGDGVVNTQDVLAFLNAYTDGDPSADINGDGVINTQDVLAFLNLWNVGCP